MAEKARSMAGQEKAMRKELVEMTAQFLDQFKTRRSSQSRSMRRSTNGLSTLPVSSQRLGPGLVVIIITETLNITLSPKVRLGWSTIVDSRAGIATVQGKNQLDEDVLQIISKVGADCLPSNRNQSLKSMV